MPEHSNTEEINPKPEKARKNWFWQLFGILLVLIATLILAMVSSTVGTKNAASFVYNFAKDGTGNISQTYGRVNILLMGKAGGDRSGDNPDLTDTMILVSLGIKNSSIVMVSIPRDIWIPEIRGKINSAYYWGGQNTSYFKSPGGTHPGITFAKQMTAEVVGEPIQYGVVIDFSAFKEIVDALGGIQVNVTTSFSDTRYPVAGRETDNCHGDPKLACRYMTVTFHDGLQTMDGERALEFVRSRHAEGVEGSDLARESRQQKVIDAIKNKISSPSVFLSPKIDFAMINILKKYIETDIDLSTSGTLARLAMSERNNIKQYVMPAGMLSTPPISKLYDNLSVFIPANGNGDWQEINKWFYVIQNR